MKNSVAPHTSYRVRVSPNKALFFFIGDKVMDTITHFAYDETGATMIEYGLVAALVSVAAIAALTFLGSSLQMIFNKVSSVLGSV